jgi:hypothetical protein
MTDPSFISASERDLLVVLHDDGEAEAAARAALDAGVPPEDVVVGGDLDRMASLRTEMHEELSQAWVVPHAGAAYPKEAARGLVLGAGLGMLLGFALAFLLAIPHVSDTDYGDRLVVTLIVGGAFGIAIGMVVGPSVGSIRPNQPSAVERGPVLRIQRDTPELRAVLSDLHPIRIDEVRHGDDLPIDTVYTEEGGVLHQTVRDLKRNVRGDDYHVDAEARTP